MVCAASSTGSNPIRTAATIWYQPPAGRLLAGILLSDEGVGMRVRGLAVGAVVIVLAGCGGSQQRAAAPPANISAPVASVLTTTTQATAPTVQSLATSTTSAIKETPTPSPGDDLCGYLRAQPTKEVALSYLDELIASVDSSVIDVALAEVNDGCPEYAGRLKAAAASASKSADVAQSKADESVFMSISKSQASEAAAESTAVASIQAEDKRQSQVTYSITGTADSALVTYTVTDGDISQENGISVPWNKSLEIPNDDYRFLSLSAQNSGDGSITCTISVAGKVVNTNTSTGAYAIASCSAS